jgi:hypothetical protein
MGNIYQIHNASLFALEVPLPLAPSGTFVPFGLSRVASTSLVYGISLHYIDIEEAMRGSVIRQVEVI